MAENSKIAIDIQALTKSYPDKSAPSGVKQAVDGVDLQVFTGEIFALLGPNGAGKSTTIEILEGFRSRSSGTVSVLGFDPANKGVEERHWRNQIGIVLQAASDAGDLTVRECLHHFAKYYTNPKDPESVIDSVGLREKVDSKIGSLSGGQRRRLDVALGIIGSPAILFLDEPTTGFDPEARRAFWDLIRNLRDEGTTILLTTHYLDEAEALADRVGVIVNGKIIEIAIPSELGGRHLAQARISWRRGGEICELFSDNPTREVIALAQEFGGDVPELSVTRPSLEEIYLSMIGGSRRE
jgi:ABC-2 type transport system ATP-binding protein